MGAQTRTISLTIASEARNTKKLRKNSPWRCPNPLTLTCAYHGLETIEVPCGRWRRCPACARRLQYKLRSRFLAGIEQVPSGLLPMFFTLTFPAERPPSESEAQQCWRSLVRRLRYRRMLAEYGFVLQRTKRGVLHFHGIGHMPWQEDALVRWRRLLAASGFGMQNKLLIAEPAHAAYIVRYISTRLAELAPLHRAYSFSRRFPQPQAVRLRQERDALLGELGARSECRWELSGSLAARLNR